MSEPLVIQTLTQKRAEILGRIKAYEAQIAQASFRDAKMVPEVTLNWRWQAAHLKRRRVVRS